MGLDCLEEATTAKLHYDNPVFASRGKAPSGSDYAV